MPVARGQKTFFFFMFSIFHFFYRFCWRFLNIYFFVEIVPFFPFFCDLFQFFGIRFGTRRLYFSVVFWYFFKHFRFFQIFFWQGKQLLGVALWGVSQASLMNNFYLWYWFCSRNPAQRSGHQGHHRHFFARNLRGGDGKRQWKDVT
jgi:hypothetical protein